MTKKKLTFFCFILINAIFLVYISFLFLTQQITEEKIALTHNNKFSFDNFEKFNIKKFISATVFAVIIASIIGGNGTPLL